MGMCMCTYVSACAVGSMYLTLTCVPPFLKSLDLHWGQQGSPPAHVGLALYPSTHPETQTHKERELGGGLWCVCAFACVCASGAHMNVCNKMHPFQ